MEQLEAGKLLLELSGADVDSFYFHSFRHGEIEQYETYRHYGTFQDSFLILADRLDIRYFAYPNQAIRLYKCKTNGMPLMIRNVGTKAITVKQGENQYIISGGESLEIPIV